MNAIATNLWQLVSLVSVFLIGGVLVTSICTRFELSGRYGVFLYFWHSTFCILYLLYSLSNPADSIGYFYNALTWDGPIALGTRFVVNFTSIFVQDLGFSYGGTFFVFNFIGCVGLLGFAASLREMLWNKSKRIRKFGLLVPFLPGFSFWSSAIGKDSLAFFAVGMVCWAANVPQKRWLVFFVGLSVMFAVRPHMAGFLIISLAFTLVFLRGGNQRAKILATFLVLPGAVMIASVSLNYVGLEGASNASDISSYIETRQSYNLEGGSSVNIANASFPIKMFTYVYRPFFFDAGGLFGLIVSVENTVLLLLSYMYFRNWLKRRSTLSRFQRFFFLFYVLFCWVTLANTTANLGIAIRQKTMFTPILILLALSYLPDVRSNVAVKVGSRERTR